MLCGGEIFGEGMFGGGWVGLCWLKWCLLGKFMKLIICVEVGGEEIFYKGCL